MKKASEAENGKNWTETSFEGFKTSLVASMLPKHI